MYKSEGKFGVQHPCCTVHCAVSVSVITLVSVFFFPVLLLLVLGLFVLFCFPHRIISMFRLEGIS